MLNFKNQMMRQDTVSSFNISFYLTKQESIVPAFF